MKNMVKNEIVLLDPYSVWLKLAAMEIAPTALVLACEMYNKIFISYKSYDPNLSNIFLLSENVTFGKANVITYVGRQGGLWNMHILWCFLFGASKFYNLLSLQPLPTMDSVILENRQLSEWEHLFWRHYIQPTSVQNSGWNPLDPLDFFGLPGTIS